MNRLLIAATATLASASVLVGWNLVDSAHSEVLAASCPITRCAAQPEETEARVAKPHSRRRTVTVDVDAAVRAAAPGAQAGAIVFDRRTNRTAYRLQPRCRFRSASLVKLLIAVDDLHRNGMPDPEHARDLHRMLSLSDDAVASELWVAGGGDAIVTRIAQRLRLTGTAPPDIPGRWGNVLLTAEDVVRVYRYILDDLPAEQRDLIVRALQAAPRRAADGWDQYFGIPDAVRAPFAVKQGWSNSATDLVVHSTGLVGRGQRYIVVLLVSAPTTTGWDALRSAVTAAADEIEPLI